ncbi:nuclear transport factor 2 family protein [Hymenobacter sp. H14-R3]|uniref:nuclear transport factor 2 family protein n=1 Tax=Hymenobacter sp. H14-R3 TaxID=3046308 RepID=UPI0024B8B7A9|nr:nuclear transport factor 2 family protein [Hymenobacter sp. H14-R3]MDJ0367802.1 nuclear transport factor 2 family protein [Hymenobacter sp. H14-R3]
MTNLDIIKRTYEGKTSEENGQQLAAYAAPNISWTEARGFPYAGTYIGLAAVTQHVFQRLGTEWEGYAFLPEDYVAAGDAVVAYGTYRGTYRATGKYMEARVAHVWHMQAGKIIRFEQFVDSYPVQQALH